MMSVDVYFVVKLPPGLIVDVELLGTRWPIPVAGVPCTLRLPRRSPYDGVDGEQWDDPETTFLYPPDCSDLTSPADESVEGWLSVDYLDEHPRWGTMRGHTGADEDNRGAIAQLAEAIVTCPYEGDDTDEARGKFFVRVGREADVGLRLLTDWLEVLGGAVFRQPQGGRWLGGIPPGWTVLSPAMQGGRVPLPAGVQWVVRDEIGRSLTAERWSLAAQLVDQGVPPPLAHLLLRDARRAHWDEDLRRAVIDAASAVEVALSAAIRTHLAAMPPKALDELVDGRLRGLVDLYRFHARGLAPITSVSLNRLDNKLAKVRNRVAHAGHRPDPDEVKTALQVAAELLPEIAPLPS
jgi:hypothetical protein